MNAMPKKIPEIEPRSASARDRGDQGSPDRGSAWLTAGMRGLYGTVLNQEVPESWRRLAHQIEERLAHDDDETDEDDE